MAKGLKRGQTRTVRISREVAEKKIEQTIDDGRISEAQCEQPRANEEGEFQLKRAIDQEDTTPVLLHPLIVCPRTIIFQEFSIVQRVYLRSSESGQFRLHLLG